MHSQMLQKDQKRTNYDDGQMVSLENWLSEKELFVLNRGIEPNEKYGPFTMDEIYFMERTAVRTTIQCLEYLSEFTEVNKLPKNDCWQLISGEQPIPNDFPPEFVRKYLEFAFSTNKPELSECEEVIVVPGTISREEFENERIQIIRRDSVYIVKAEVIPEKWFILQSCRRAHYERYTPWHLVFKECVDDIDNVENII
jgi:hypothetical protein